MNVDKSFPISTLLWLHAIHHSSFLIVETVTQQLLFESYHIFNETVTS
jgi:hypothetical protein